MKPPAIMTASEAMRTLLRWAERVAQTDDPVVLVGEPGTGKDLLARWIHDRSPRAGGPFAQLRCMGLPETVLTTELFGYRRYAWPEAHTDRPGLFETTRGGTLFLAEVESLPLSVQVQVLRLLETGMFTPPGADRPVPVDVRLIVSVVTPSGREVPTFLGDQLVRRGGFVLRVPPLRERPEDILFLADRFVQEVNPRLRLSPEVRGLLLAYPWPGNVRELHNALRHAALLAEDDEVRVEHLPAWLRAGREPP